VHTCPTSWFTGCMWKDLSSATLPVTNRASRTQQPDRQFRVTGGLVCVKARETSFFMHKFSSQISEMRHFAEHLNFQTGETGETTVNNSGTRRVRPLYWTHIKAPFTGSYTLYCLSQLSKYSLRYDRLTTMDWVFDPGLCHHISVVARTSITGRACHPPRTPTSPNRAWTQGLCS